MSRWLRFADLKARGIVKSWAMLRRRIERDDFPPGRMLGPNIRAWSEDDEINPWLKSRPTVGPAPRGAAKTRRGRPRKTDHHATA
jgi:predicted DNA-binding transcriptional regulator AlpA